MESNNPNNNIEDSIDLIIVLKFFGKKISNLNSLFNSNFRIIYNFFRAKVVYFISAFIIGIVLGEVSKYIIPQTFDANFVVKASPEIRQKLYREIDFMNKLIEDKNSNTSYGAFGLDNSKFEVIKGFTIEPLDNLFERKILFDNYISTLDSTMSSDVDFDSFQERLSNFDFPKHRVYLNVSEPVDFSVVFKFVTDKFLSSKELKKENELKITKSRNEIKLYNDFKILNDTVLVSLLKNNNYFEKTSDFSDQSVFALDIINQTLNNQLLAIEKIQTSYDEQMNESQLSVIDQYIEPGVIKNEHRKFWGGIACVTLLFLFFLIKNFDNRLKY